MTGHYIVCGLGHVGYRVADILLRLGERVSVVTLASRDEWIGDIRERGADVILGDARDERLLLQAGLTEARAVLATSDQDLVNVEIGLDCRQARPDLPLVLRIFDQNLAEQLEETFDVRRALAMSVLAAPSFAAAALGQQVAGSFKADDTLFVVGRRVVEEGSPLSGATLGSIASRYHLAPLALERDGQVIDVPGADCQLQPGDRLTAVGDRRNWDRLSGAPLHRPTRKRAPLPNALLPATWLRGATALWRGASLPLRTIFLLLNALLLISVLVFHFAMGISLIDSFYFIVSTVTTTGYGDITPLKERPALKLFACLIMILGPATMAVLFSMVTDYVVTARFAQLLGRRRTPHEDHVIVSGLGTLGYRVVDNLHRAGVPVLAIERDPQNEFVEAVRSHSEVLVGDARLASTLERAGVARARAVLAVSGDDATNLGVVLESRRRTPHVRTVVRMFDPGFAAKVKDAFQLDAAMGASGIAAPTFVGAALYPDVRAALVLEDRLFILLQCAVRPQWNGRTTEELRDLEGITVLMRRAGAAELAIVEPGVPLRAGESVLAVACRTLSS